MTCCVALRTKFKNGRSSIFIGADSSACSDNEVMSTVDPKVFVVRDYTFAFAGEQRVGQIIKYGFSPPAPPNNKKHLNRFMTTTFMFELSQAFKANSVIKTSDTTFGDSELIVSVHGRLFWVGPDFSILEMLDDVVAIGIGKEYALGAIHATSEYNDEDRVKMALNAAAHFSPWVKGPFHVIKAR